MEKFTEKLLKVLKVVISFSSFVWLAVLLFVVDIVSKQIVLHNMVPGQMIELIPNFLSINYVVNDGMAFGIDFRDETLNRVMFAVISVIGMIILVGAFSYKYSAKTKLVKASMMLMISGCFGNLIDRAFYSAEYLNADTNGVVDFIGFKFGTYEFPRFNVADSCLVIGVVLLVVWLAIAEVKELKNKKKETVTEKVVSKDEQLMAQRDESKENEEK